MTADDLPSFDRYPLLDALRGRRSRRFGLGMRMDHGPLAYSSAHAPLPLTEHEEAALVFAACGVTGRALGDLPYAPGEGGNILAGLLGRTVAAGDAIHSVSLIVTNDEATYLMRRPQDFEPAEIHDLIALSSAGEITELYRRGRVRVKARRAAAPLEPMANIAVNKWSLHAPGSTYFLPVNELTFMYINGLLEIFNETTGAFIVDERASFRPAGLKRFAASRGGHLDDDPAAGRVATIAQLEFLVSEVVTIEQGMMLQNLGLMSEAMGLGGFPNFAEHPFAWFEELGFRSEAMPASRYLGAGVLAATMMRLLGRERPVPFPVGLERDGAVLLKAYCPPYFASMEEAVRAVVDAKFARGGVFRGEPQEGAWKDPGAVAAAVPEISDAAVAASIAYCEYVHRRYRRFPAYVAPFRTVLGYQAAHVDVDFYDRFYGAQALSQTQREHLARWHGKSAAAGESV